MAKNVLVCLEQDATVPSKGANPNTSRYHPFSIERPFIQLFSCTHQTRLDGWFTPSSNKQHKHLAALAMSESFVGTVVSKTSKVLQKVRFDLKAVIYKLRCTVIRLPFLRPKSPFSNYSFISPLSYFRGPNRLYHSIRYPLLHRLHLPTFLEPVRH